MKTKLVGKLNQLAFDAQMREFKKLAEYNARKGKTEIFIDERKFNLILNTLIEEGFNVEDGYLFAPINRGHKRVSWRDK